MFAFLGRLTCRAPWLLVLASLLVVVFSAHYGRDAMRQLALAPGWEVPHSGSALARTQMRDQLGKDEVPVILLFRARGDTPPQVDHPTFRDAVEAALAPLSGNPEVYRVDSYYTSADARMRGMNGDLTYALAWIERGQDEGISAFHRLREQVRSDRLSIEFGGELATYVDMREELERDVWRAEVASFVLLAPLLVWVFGSVVAASLPLVIGGITVVVSTALLKWFDQYTEISVYAANVVSMLGLGLAIDYSLFMVSRFREELARGNGDSTCATLGTAGRTVAFSGLTVAASLFCLFLLPQRFFHNMGLAGGLAISVAMLTSILLLPALLNLLGPRVNWLAVPTLARRAARQETGGHWHRYSHFVMRHAGRVLLGSILVLAVLGLPILHMQIGPADSRSLPASAESRHVQETLERQFPNAELSPLIVTLRARGEVQADPALTALHALTGQIQALPGVTRVVGLASLDPGLSIADYRLLYRHPADFPIAGAALTQFARGSHTLMYVQYDHPPGSEAARELVRQLRALPLPDGLEAAQVGGFPAEHVDYVDSLRAGVPWVILAIVGIILVLLFLLLGSVVLPLKAALTNLLSLSATFGGLVWIFQDGNLSGLLGFTPQGQLEGTVLVLIFATAFGLSIDYEVFLLSRVKEMRLRTGNNIKAIAAGIQRSGPIITSAALLIGIVLGTFATTDVVFMKAMALGMLISVFVDATLVRRGRSW
jgi:RND superfamily putative drug exporter